MADETSQPPEGDAEQQTTEAPEPVVETAAQELAKEDVHAVEPSPESKWQENAQAAQEANPEKFPRLKKLVRAYWSRKKWTVPVSIAMLLAILFGVPFTRYALLGLVLKSDTPVVVTDSGTGQPVTDATITADGKTVKTDNHGAALVRLKVGKHQLTVAKQYYKTYQVTVFTGILHTAVTQVNAVATGRQVPISVTDYITGKPLENAVITASGSTAKTNNQGKAVLVLSAKATSEQAVIKLNGYNDTVVSVLVTARVVTTNQFKITAAGKLYFLSNQSGNIDVVKTDLDGKNRKTILAGTGKEDAYSTSLLASRDWKYLALLSKRDGNQGIYLIDTSDDKVTNIDGGNANATFTLVGWSGSTFVYQTQRSNVSTWQSGAQVLKSYDAAGGKLYTLDQTQGEGTGTYDYGYQNFSTVALLNNEVVYAKNWYSSQFPDHLSGKSSTLYSIHPDGSGKKTIKDFAVPTGTSYAYIVSLSQYEPYSLYVQAPTNTSSTYYAYEAGNLTQRPDVTDDTWSKPYPTYLVSPSSKATFWSDVRDNKNTLFVGNGEGGSGKQIATLSDYTPYGWYTDNYILVSKNGSELYVMPADGSKPPVKTTDYYKPQLTYKGYGGGYGGI